MLLYLDHAWEKSRAEGRMNISKICTTRSSKARCSASGKDHDCLRDSLWSAADHVVPVTEAGADVMKRIATPMIGGIVTPPSWNC